MNYERQNILKFPEKYWMKGEELSNTNFYNSEKKDKKVEWVAPTAKRVKQYDIEVKKGLSFMYYFDYLENLYHYEIQ